LKSEEVRKRSRTHPFILVQLGNPMENIDYETGVPAPQVQNLFDKVEIDENVASC